MVDTGAEISLLPGEHQAVRMHATRIKPTTVQPVTVDGKPILLKGVLEMEVEIGGTKGLHTFYITSDPGITPILGLDIMRRMGRIAVDFTKGDLISFGPLSAEPPARIYTSSTPKVQKITVQLGDDVVIPARHEMIVQAKLVVEDQRQLSQLREETLVIEPGHKESESIVWGRAIVTEQNGRVPMRVCNPSMENTTLHAGTTIGEAETLPAQPVLAVVTDDVMTAEVTNVCNQNETINELVDRAEISEREKALLRQMLHQYKQVFSIDGELGKYEEKLFKIDTGNAAPIRSMPRPVPHHKKVEVDRQIDEMLERGLIAPSNSEWASPILMVKKKDGSLRFCIDYRRVNDVTKHDSFPLPNIHDCLSSLNGQCNVISSLDMARGYWQMGADPETQEKLAFTTHRGLFKPLVQPFGPKGGVAHFSRIMNSLLGSMQWEQILIYLDDILVFGRNFEEHLGRLQKVFATLIKANLKLKPQKCKLFKQSVAFLGHSVSAEGILPLQDKIEVMKSWPIPSNKEDVSSFLGLASYYRRFVDNFAITAEPLNRLTRKNVIFQWDADCEEAFLRLREALINPPVLAYPDFAEKFILTTDASGVGIGAVLSQIQNGQERVVAYASRTLNKAERNYSATERECLGIIWATEHYQYYLLGAPFIIYTDHNPLAYLRSVSQPQGRLARWILKLEQYDYEVRYKPGKSIPHADALSRHPAYVAGVQLPVEWSPGEFRKAQEEDRVLSKVRHYLRLGRPPPDREDTVVKEYCRKKEQIIDGNGILMIKYTSGRDTFKQLLVPDILIPRILEKAHDDKSHYAADKILPAIRQQYYWPTLFKDVGAWCRTCVKCQGRKHPSTQARAPLQYFPIAGEPGQMVAMDFVGPLVESKQGNLHMLVITDAFSKFADVLALPNQTASVTANALWFQHFSKYGVPAMLHSDQGKNFESAVVKHLCDYLGIQKTRTSGYHPQGNGAVERYNKTLVERLSLLMVQEDQTDWEDCIPQALFDYNSTPHSSTGLTPFQLHMGRQPRSPFEMLSYTSPEVKKKPVKAYMSTYQKNIKIQKTIAQDNLKKAMEQRKTYYDKKIHYEPYTKGDLVMCRNFTCKQGLKPKLMQERWSGPWKVDKVRGPVNYRITRKLGQKIFRLLVHYNRLKPYHQRPPQLQPPDTVSDGVGGDEMSGPLLVSQREVSDTDQSGAEVEHAVAVPDREAGRVVSDSGNAVAEVDHAVTGPEHEGYETDTDSDSEEEVEPDIDSDHEENVENVAAHPRQDLPQATRSGRIVKRGNRLIEDPQFGNYRKRK